ncbi:MAG: phosphonate metabolism transcriptional regulator PhnF [Pseudomonadota bacterium]
MKADANRVDRNSGIAIWRQIADALRQLIASGELDDETKLPAESALARRFSVNRHTVRAAINALAAEGVLESHQGRGTFIRRRPRVIYPIGARTRFTEGVAQQSQSAVTEVISSSEEKAVGSVCDALNLQAGIAVLRLETLSRADGIALSRSTSWFYGIGFDSFAERVQQMGSITKALASAGVTDYLRKSTIIEAHHADQMDTVMMGLSPGAIIIETKAINTKTDRTPLQYVQTRFASDRISLVVNT